MGRFINGERPRCSPRLNIVKPARFDADHKELVNGVEKAETQFRQEDVDDVDDKPKKKTKKSSKNRPIRRSSRKSVLLKTNSPGVVTRSHLKQTGPKPYNVHNGSQAAHKDGKRKEDTNETQIVEAKALGEDKQVGKPNTRRNPTAEQQSVRVMRQQNISPSCKKKYKEMDAKKTQNEPARVHKSRPNRSNNW